MRSDYSLNTTLSGKNCSRHRSFFARAADDWMNGSRIRARNLLCSKREGSSRRSKLIPAHTWTRATFLPLCCRNGTCLSATRPRSRMHILHPHEKATWVGVNASSKLFSGHPFIMPPSCHAMDQSLIHDDTRLQYRLICSISSNIRYC